MEFLATRVLEHRHRSPGSAIGWDFRSNSMTSEARQRVNGVQFGFLNDICRGVNGTKRPTDDLVLRLP